MFILDVLSPVLDWAGDSRRLSSAIEESCDNDFCVSCVNGGGKRSLFFTITSLVSSSSCASIECNEILFSIDNRRFVSSSLWTWRWILEFFRFSWNFRRLPGEELILDLNDGDAFFIDTKWEPPSCISSLSFRLSDPWANFSAFAVLSSCPFSTFSWRNGFFWLLKPTLPFTPNGLSLWVFKSEAFLFVGFSLSL